MDPEFRKLSAGQGVSVVGSNVTLIALPFTAALTLGTTPQEMGLLSAAGWLPILLFSLFAGAWADGLRRRPVLIVDANARLAGLWNTLAVSLAGQLLGLLYVPWSPLRAIRTMHDLSLDEPGLPA